MHALVERHTDSVLGQERDDRRKDVIMAQRTRRCGQFEEIGVDEAPTVQALLGPLAEAIVVEDPASAFAGIVRAAS